MSTAGLCSLFDVFDLSDQDLLAQKELLETLATTGRIPSSLSDKYASVIDQEIEERNLGSEILKKIKSRISAASQPLASSNDASPTPLTAAPIIQDSSSAIASAFRSTNAEKVAPKVDRTDVNDDLSRENWFSFPTHELNRVAVQREFVVFGQKKKRRTVRQKAQSTQEHAPEKQRNTKPRAEKSGPRIVALHHGTPQLKSITPLTQKSSATRGQSTGIAHCESKVPVAPQSQRSSSDSVLSSRDVVAFPCEALQMSAAPTEVPEYSKDDVHRSGPAPQNSDTTLRSDAKNESEIQEVLRRELLHQTGGAGSVEGDMLSLSEDSVQHNLLVHERMPTAESNIDAEAAEEMQNDVGVGDGAEEVEVVYDEEEDEQNDDEQEGLEDGEDDGTAFCDEMEDDDAAVLNDGVQFGEAAVDKDGNFNEAAEEAESVDSEFRVDEDELRVVGSTVAPNSADAPQSSTPTPNSTSARTEDQFLPEHECSGLPQERDVGRSFGPKENVSGKPMSKEGGSLPKQSTRNTSPHYGTKTASSASTKLFPSCLADCFAVSYFKKKSSNKDGVDKKVVDALWKAWKTDECLDYSGPRGPADAFYYSHTKRSELNDTITAAADCLDWYASYSVGKGLWQLMWSWQRPAPSLMSRIFFFQRIHRYPNTGSVLTRKDALSKLLARWTKLPGKTGDFFRDVVPPTFALPAEISAFSSALYETSESGAWWILKPASLSRGRGIRVIKSFEEVEYGEPSVVQKYVSHPLLLDGRKFDLRLYVLVTSFGSDLSAYIFSEGLARFARSKFTIIEGERLNPYVHLTNSSVNKNTDGDGTVDDAEIKFPLSSTLKRLQSTYDIDIDTLWNKIVERVLASLIAAQEHISSHPCCFELLGYDMLIDASQKVWLLEVNASPMLQLDGETDEQIKIPLVRDIMRIVTHGLPRVNADALCDWMHTHGPFDAFDKTSYDSIFPLGTASGTDIPLGGFQRIAPSPLYSKILKLKKLCN
eukprot:ANDGO_05854.mRNA.1 putative alpha-tubulin polyglutamylase Ttll1